MQRPQPAPETIDALLGSILADPKIRHLGDTALPERGAITDLVDDLRALIFPGFFGRRNLNRQTLAAHVEDSLAQLSADLYHEVRASLRYVQAMGGGDGDGAPDPVDCDREAARITHEFIARLPEVRRKISLDVQAAYEGDPAAENVDEIIFCYPGVQAIMVHRLAHELYRMDVPLLPRIMSEYAHTTTGIDIHPGAVIGESFFIDHGTGVVIGETTVIGKNVKIYQGVTLGARSFPKDARGRLVRGVKRHPTLGDRVTVYAGATILGGDTVIGDDCVIAGGVFLTRSVPPGHVVRAEAPQLNLRTNPESGQYEMFASGI